MDKFKERVAILRHRLETAEAAAEAAEADNKTLLQEIHERDALIASLLHNLSLREASIEVVDRRFADLKNAATEADSYRTTEENLARKVRLLEDELEQTEKKLQETTEELRTLDVRAEHFERSVTRAEKEKEEWERKYNDIYAKLTQTKHELDEVAALSDLL